MKIAQLILVFAFFVAFVNPHTAKADVLFSQSVMLRPDWNIVSTPRILESHEFSAPEISDNFDIFVLDASKPAGWATMADLGQSEFIPLYGYFIRNKTGTNQILTFNYKADVPPNERLFQRTFMATGWYSIGVANPSYAKPRGGSITDTNNVDPILNSLLGTFSYYGTVVDFTDAIFSVEPDSLALTDPWKAVVRSPDVSNTTEINKLNDFRETKGYAIYIKQAGSLYSGFQNNDIPPPPPPPALSVEKSNTVVAGNIGVDVANTALGALTLEATGEAIQITRFKILLSRTDPTDDILDVGLYDSSGTLVAGPNDSSSDTNSSVTFTDTFTVPMGTHTYIIKGKLATTFENNDTITVSFTPSTDIIAKSQITDISVTASPLIQISANTQTVKRASLTVDVASFPSAQNVVRGVNGFHFASYQFDVSSSGEDIRVTSFSTQLTYTGSPGATDLNTCQMFDGATALNTGTNLVTPLLDGTSPDDVAFTFDTHLVISKGTVKTVDLKCNISSNAVEDSTYAWGLGVNSDAAVTGKDTGTAVTETIIAGTGQTMIIKTAGKLTITLDSSSPAERLVIAGKTDVLLTVLKLHANDEAIKLDRIALTLASSTASTTDFKKVTMWDGATKVGEAVFTGGNSRATSTLSGSFVVPKDGDKLLSIKADLETLGVNLPATRGHLIAVNYDGEATTTTRGIGQSSGTFINPAQGADSNGKGVRMVKSLATLERLSLPTNTLSDGTLDLYRFKVTADASGDVGLYKFTFKIATTGFDTVNNLNIYAYSDSSFSVNAYNANPVTKDNRGNVTASSSSALPFYFNPDNGGTGKEALQVPAGSSRYFKLVGGTSGTGAGDSVAVQLEGDAGVPVDTNTVGRETASVVDGAATHNDFIWSPNTTTTAATTTNDWMNGYLLPGLPNDNMQSQTISR